MADSAHELVDTLRRVLGVEPAANGISPPQWVDLAAEAKRRGMSTTALRVWCLKRGVTIREESHRRAWVQPAAIDAAVEGLPAAKRAQSPPAQAKADELDRLIDAQAQQKPRGKRSTK